MKRETKKILAEIILIVLVCSYNKMFIFALIWVFLHEITHILVALKFGCKFYNIEFHIFGMKAELIDIDSLRENQKIIVYLSGALLNIVLAIFFYIINIKYNSSFIETSMNLNIGLAVFNLLPAYPLDGSRILEVILSKRMLFKKAQKIISIVSFSIAALFIIIAVIIYIFLHSLNLSMIIGAIIIIYITRMEEHTTMYITMSNVVKKRHKLLKNKYIENKSISVYYKQGLVNVLALVDRNKFNTFYILDDDMKLIYILNEDELIDALKVYGNMTLEEYIKQKLIIS
ncbi:site-2 protease family protein [Clostridium tertium]|jgi:stage IV sporulation protein FB|uniref:site-2 protease family protein n=1 Tax=Clostridium TaxID=1485 RepID=UPI001158B873|nr:MULTISPECIES: site-2 protease family protein [Clostridium]MBS5307324.1 site-2 protease family protein [Clostridium sp.]MBS6500833.1 site-2 protease family protein [Clostridium sp.]MDB1921511.1 site-2 protease family protein [Clostridium tertium]MDB1924755.1 site-2 protease family protein [Clostridium tertium]MDB1928283.1 site-2 protease family protein [Clostridium tertium]